MSDRLRLVSEFNSSRFTRNELGYLIHKLNPQLSTSLKKKDLAETLSHLLLGQDSRKRSHFRDDRDLTGMTIYSIEGPVFFKDFSESGLTPEEILALNSLEESAFNLANQVLISLKDITLDVVTTKAKATLTGEYYPKNLTSKVPRAVIKILSLEIIPQVKKETGIGLGKAITRPPRRA